MTRPIFVKWEQVLRAHERSLRAFGGSSGLRDEGLLRSAIAQPLHDYYYGHADHFGIAASYAFHIAQAQAFVDGNKRAAIAAALGFLEQNGIATATATEALHESMIAIAERRLSKAELAQVLRELFG